MKSFASGKVLAAWLLRFMLIVFVYRNYFKEFTDFDFNDFGFYISAAYLLFTILLLAGGMLEKETLTVISSLVIFVLPIVQFIREIPKDIADTLLVYLIPLSVGFAFFTFGNNK